MASDLITRGFEKQTLTAVDVYKAFNSKYNDTDKS